MSWADDKFEESSEDFSDSENLSHEPIPNELIPKNEKIRAKPINIPPKLKSKKSDLNGKILIGRIKKINQWKKKPIQIAETPKEEKNQGDIFKEMAVENIAKQKELQKVQKQKNELLGKLERLARENMSLIKKRLEEEKKDLEGLKFQVEQMENKNKKLKELGNEKKKPEELGNEKKKPEELGEKSVFSLFKFESFNTTKNPISEIAKTESVIPKKILSSKKIVPSKKIVSSKKIVPSKKIVSSKHRQLFRKLKKNCKEMDCKNGKGGFIRITPNSGILSNVLHVILERNHNNVDDEDVKKLAYRLIEIIECCEKNNLIPSFAFTLNIDLLNRISLLYWDETNKKLIEDNFQKILKSLSFNLYAKYHWKGLLELIDYCNLENLEIYLTPALLTALKNWDDYWESQLTDLYRKIEEEKIIFLDAKGKKISLPKIKELVNIQQNLFDH